MTASRSVRGMGDRCVFTELFLTWLLLHQTFRCPWPRLARLPLTLGRRGLMLPGRLVLRPVPTPRSAPGAPPWGRSQYRARRGLGEMDPMSGGRQQRQAGGAPSRLRVFINYRRDDTWAAAQLVYDRLANSFGSENVFLDVQDLQPGMKWLEEIKSHRASSDVLLSLIGPHWVSIMKARGQAAEPAEDYVRFEIEYALRATSRIWVIPVLVGDVMPLRAGRLPRPLQALAKIQAAQVRQQRFADDIADLISRIEAIARQEQPPAAEPAAAARTDAR